jgi:hypothetical protein
VPCRRRASLDFAGRRDLFAEAGASSRAHFDLTTETLCVLAAARREVRRAPAGLLADLTR